MTRAGGELLAPVLEGRRDEPATVGDLLEANEAQATFIRSEVEAAVADYGDTICDAVATRVEQRLLEPLGLADENEENGEGNGGAAKRKPGGTSKGKTRRGLRKGQMFYDADGSGPYVFNGPNEEDEVPDDGRRRAT